MKNLTIIKQIEQRKQKLQEYKNSSIFNNNILQIAEQRTSNEVEDQLYHLNERLKLQLQDEVKSIYNGQMTKIVILMMKTSINQNLLRSDSPTSIFRTVPFSRTYQEVFS